MVDRKLTAMLNRLIRLFKDAEKAYGRAIELSQDERLKATYAELCKRRQDFADEIQTLMAAIGEDAADEGTLDMSLEITLNEIQLPFSSDRDKFILNALANGIHDSVDDFENVLREDLPTSVRGILEQQYEIYKSDEQTLQNMLANYQ